MKTTVKIKTVLFGTFRYTFQLLLYIIAAPIETFVVAWYQLSNTLVIEGSRLCIAGHTVEYFAADRTIKKIIKHVNMPRTIESPAKCEVRAVIRFLHAEG